MDPPPIIELHVTDPETGQPDSTELRYPFTVVHCSLWNVSDTRDETTLIQADGRPTRRLMGTLVSSPFVANDEHDREGCFFTFPDLSCRTHGRYRLRFVLMRINPSNLRPGASSAIIAKITSDIFTVYSAKDFPGMRPSTALTRALKRQGCAIQVKKGNEKILARRVREVESEGEEAEAERSWGKRARLDQA